MPAPAAFPDECVDLELVDALRRRDFSVTSLLLVGPRGAPDSPGLDRAVELGCVLVSHYVCDFRALHAAFEQQKRSHGGITCLPQTRPFSRLELRVAMTLDWVGTQPHSTRLFLWGSCGNSSCTASASPAIAKTKSARPSARSEDAGRRSEDARVRART